MSEDSSNLPLGRREGIFSAISLGAFFILVGVIFATTPDLLERIVAFFSNFGIVEVSAAGIFLPAPKSPWAHSTVYSAAAQFSFGLGILQILVLALRLVTRSALSKTAETVSNLVFWFGTGYLINMLLNETTTTRIWFAFWAGILVLIGISMVVRAMILLARR